MLRYRTSNASYSLVNVFATPKPPIVIEPIRLPRRHQRITIRDAMNRHARRAKAKQPIEVTLDLKSLLADAVRQETDDALNRAFAEYRKTSLNYILAHM